MRRAFTLIELLVVMGPGGNLSLAWPIDIPPPGGWENQ